MNADQELTFDLSGHNGLRLWHGTLLKTVRQDSIDLSARQQALLLQIYLEPAPHTVRGLAAALQVSKPVVTRALDTLSTMGLVRRKRDEADKRNVLVQRTVKGAVYLTDLADLIEKTNSEL